MFVIVVSAVALDGMDGIRKTRNTLTLISCPPLLLLLAFPITAASHLFLWLVVTLSNPITCKRSNKKQTKQNHLMPVHCTYICSICLEFAACQSDKYPALSEFKTQFKTFLFRRAFSHTIKYADFSSLYVLECRFLAHRDIVLCKKTHAVQRSWEYSFTCCSSSSSSSSSRSSTSSSSSCSSSSSSSSSNSSSSSCSSIVIIMCCCTFLEDAKPRSFDSIFICLQMTRVMGS